MNSRTAGQTDRSVPQTFKQIVEARRIIPQEFVLQRTAGEVITEVSPRSAGDERARLVPKKRKSISENSMVDSDARRTFASSCEVSGETHSLLEVDETRERNAAEVGEGPHLFQVAPSHGCLWLTPPGHGRGGANRGLDPRLARDPLSGRVPGARGKEARREGGCGGQEA